MSVTLIKNFYTDGTVPPTPTDLNFDIPEISPLQDRLIKFGETLGRVIGYKQEQNGRIIQNIIPIQKTELKQISTSSKTELQLHTETAFHPYKPTHLMLYCLRGDKSAVTTYAKLEDILAKLDDETIQILQQPFFITSLDDSFRLEGQPDCELFASVLTCKNKRWSMIYDEALMRGVNDEAQKALDNFTQAVHETTQEIVLEDGDLLVIDNRDTVHGRKPFIARYDGTDRWLQRVLISSDAIPKQHLSGNVVITNFGKN